MGLCKRKSSGPKEISRADDGQIRLKREIGLIHGVSIIIGVIVGSGIFVSPVGVLSHVHSVGLSMVLWTVCGVFSALGAICYAELGTTIPRSGGEYIYILEAFGGLPAFMCLWINFICIGAVANAANSLIFATYILKPLFPECEPPEIALQLVATVSITFLTAINCFNVKWAAKMAIVFTFAKLSALALVIVVGFVYMGKGNTHYLTNTFEGSNYAVGPFALAFYSGFWAYAGWNYLNFLIDELQDPKRNLPLAIVISLSTVTVTYLLANVCYLTVLSPDEMLESSAVAVLFADRTLGVMAWVMPVFVACSVFGTMNSEMLSMSRVFYCGAKEGHLPSIMAMINYKWLTPAPSVIVLMIMTLIFQYCGDIFYLIELSGFAFAVVMCSALGVLIYLRITKPHLKRPIRAIFTLLFLISSDIFYLIELTGFCYTMLICAAIGCLLYLRWKRPDMVRPIKLPLAIPIFLFFWTLFIVFLTIYQQPMESLIGIGIFLSGIPVYLLGVTWSKKPKCFTNFTDKTTVVFQKIFMVVFPDKEIVD